MLYAVFRVSRCTYRSGSRKFNKQANRENEIFQMLAGAKLPGSQESKESSCLSRFSRNFESIAFRFALFALYGKEAFRCAPNGGKGLQVQVKSGSINFRLALVLLGTIIIIFPTCDGP